MNILDSVMTAWKRMNPNQKTLVGISVLGVLALVLALGTWAGRPDFQVLYSGLKPEDGGRIVEKLRTRKIPFQLRDGGTTVLVPTQSVYETRLQLATEGLPQAGTAGYELFDKTSFGMTDFVQKLNYQRALEGELTRTIQQVEEVEQARVHIVMPEPHLYSEDKTKPTASVVLKLRGGGRLSQGQVQGVTHLLASSVEGLQPEDITIIDTNGNVLSKGHSNAAVGLSSDQLELQQNVETYLGHKVQSMLEGVLGANRAVVQVNAELDFNKIDRTVEKYDPDNQVIRSEERNNTQGAGQAGDKTTSSVVNYEISKSVEHIAAASGGLKKLTVAVMVDGAYKADKKGNRTYQSRTPEEMEKIRGIVRNAVGLDDARGDQMEVANVAFDTSTLDLVQKDMKKAETMNMVSSVGGKVAMAVVALVLFLLARGALSGMTRNSQSGMGLDEIHQDETLDPEVAMRRRLEDRVNRLAREKPQEVATLVRAWLREGGES